MQKATWIPVGLMSAVSGVWPAVLGGFSAGVVIGSIIGFFFILAVDLTIGIFSPLLGEGSAQLANEWGEQSPPSRLVRNLTLIPPLIWFYLRSPYIVKRPSPVNTQAWLVLLVIFCICSRGEFLHCSICRRQNPTENVAQVWG